jgi:uncharacterized repeat protein (TIGR03803 family)
MTNRIPLRHLLTLFVLTSCATAVLRAQTYTDIHDFNETDGCCAGYPSMLAQGRDGNIYGATTSGGTHFYGNIFKMTPSGTLTSIYSFDLTHGGGPQGGITLGIDGNFYGTTYEGGTGHAGVVFKITPAGVYTELYDFMNTTDGGFPRVPPTQAQDGNLYGVTGNDSGTVLYKITTSGVFTTMAALPWSSYSPLLLGTDGNLYGTAQYGGTSNQGIVFQFSPGTKVLKTIYNFKTEGSPHGPLMQGTDGALYGTTAGGGTGSGGVVYRVTIAGVYKVLINFSSGTSVNGGIPFAGLAQGSDKFLYGVNSVGGANGLGTLFKISMTGTGFAVLHDFATVTGDSPLSTPLLHTNGKIYGLASHGGAKPSNGVVYSLANGLLPFTETVMRKSAKEGTVIEMLGQGFSSATGVLFGASPSVFTATSNTYLTATVPPDATTASIEVLEPTGNLLTPLKFKVLPGITSFSPASGPVGTVVTINGTGLSQATAVKFGGIAATAFTVNSDIKITATVPTGAITGKISVTTPGGVGNSATTFTVN